MEKEMETLEIPAFAGMTETAKITETTKITETAGTTENAETTETITETTENPDVVKTTDTTKTLEETNNEEYENTNEGIDYINFESEELTPYKDVFKNSKISKEDFERFKSGIEKLSGEEAFSKEMIEIYGDDAENALNSYRKLTDDIFTEEEKETLNKCPYYVKTMLVKMGNSFGEKYKKLQKEYGLTTQETVAKPEITGNNAKEKFRELTNRIINNDYRSMEEYNNIIDERLKIAEFINY